MVTSSLQSRRNFLRILDEQRRKPEEREARLAREWRSAKIFGSLSTRVLRLERQPEVTIFTFNLSSQNHNHVAKYVFSITDEQYERLGDNTVLEREMFSSGCRSFLNNARA